MDSLPPAELPPDARAPLLIPAVAEKPEKPVKSTSYAAKKSVAQRMMDIALLTSNANQLRYVLRFGLDSPTFMLSVVLIALSLSLQVAVGIFMIFKVKPNATAQEKEQSHNMVVGGVFLITIVNVLVTAFSLEENEQRPDITLTNRLGNFSADGSK